MKRLFFDLEVSPDVVCSWRVGRKITLRPENILRERAVICCCYKWENEKKIHSLKWNNGDDRELIKEFSNVLEEADVSIAHNIAGFDLKWYRGRHLIHNLPPIPDYKVVDTLKIARKYFLLNSNTLDYLGELLLGEGKIKTDYSLWKNLILNPNDTTTLNKMIRYCKKDVDLLERVYERLASYDTSPMHVGVLNGLGRWSCPYCGSDHVHLSKTRTTPKGIVQKQMQCNDCGRYYSIANKVYMDYLVAKDEKNG